MANLTKQKHKELYKTRFYRIWTNMKDRCNRTSHQYYDRYGGRGISVCEKWNTFGGFFDDMYESYEDELTIERINNNNGYNKENCKWATRREQANNTKRNRIVEYAGLRKTIAEWARYVNIKSSTFRQRFYVYKWSFDKIISFNNNYLG